MAGSRSATRALAYRLLSDSISQGTPSEGKSVGIRLFIAPRLVFIAAVAASTWARRLAGSAMCVPRLTTVMVAWLFDEVSPLARVETGTPATSDLRGSGPCLRKWRRSAPLQTISTASFRLALCLRRVAFNAASGRLIDANARVAETVVLSRVRGASARLLTRLPRAAAPCPLMRDITDARVPPAVSPTFCVAICDSTLTVPGIAFTASNTSPAWLPSTPRSMSARPSSRRTLPRRCWSTSRPAGLRSRMAWPSATAACPSTAAWCSCVYIAKRLVPPGPSARPSNTWNFHSGRLRSSSTVCSRPTCASSSACPLPSGKEIPTTCSSRSGSSSTQVGLLRLSGIFTSFWRSAGASTRRAAMWRRMSARKSPS